MAQIFHRSTNTISRFTIYGFVFVLAALSWALYIWQGSGWFNRMGEAEEQPVPFSHQHHVGGLGIDCRYCHTSVETSSFAGIPPTKTCMNCHSHSGPMLPCWSQSGRAIVRAFHCLDSGQRRTRLRLLRPQHSH